MSTNAKTEATDATPATEQGSSTRFQVLKLPGLIAISLYMVLISGVAVVSVMQGQVGAVYLVFSVLFIAGALGLLLLLRWAWALTLAAVAILSGWCLWGFSTQHSFPALVQGVLNLFFFLYLVRTDVREKLK